MSESPDTQAVRFSLAGRARPKGRPRFSSKNGVRRHYTPKTTTDYEGAVRASAIAAMGDQPRFEGPVSVTIRIRCEPPARTSRSIRAEMIAGNVLPTNRLDIDNVQKSVADAISGVLIRDDADIVDLVGSKRYADEAGIDVIVEPVGAEYFNRL